MNNFIYPIVALGAIGGIFGLILQYASTVFYVEEDERVLAVNEALPGANCGACGFPGCMGLAEAIVGGAPVNSCPVGGQETADKVAEIMGVASAAVDRKVAVVLCQGDCDKAKSKFDFIGVQDCRSMDMYYEGHKECSDGCLGGGTCFDVCAFGAITMVNGIAVIDKEKCTACNKCIEVCPKNVIKLVPYTAKTVVKCNTNDKAKDVRSNCTIGCIGCKLCEKNCPKDAIHVNDFLAEITYDKCIDCGICYEKCPTKCISAEYKNKVKTKELEEEAV